jgi:DMSO/TMAO reductase YedYZ molybdopterin-dependent catalytic subunit
MNRIVKRMLTERVERGAEQLRDAGALDRRGFVRLMSLGVVAPLVAACGLPGSEGAQRLLKSAEQNNEKLERWLLRTANASDRVPRGVPIAGNAFPSYFVSRQMPVWNSATMGDWTLTVDGAVQSPRTFTWDEVRRLATRTHTVQHYCVEGWNAAAQFQGIPFTQLARLVKPTADAGFVDFSSFDSGYHESWDVESTMHPQTLVVVAKDGQALSPAYGAPARVHSPIKLGYKNTKYLTRITFMPAPNGGYWSSKGYEWFGGT